MLSQNVYDKIIYCGKKVTICYIWSSQARYFEDVEIEVASPSHNITVGIRVAF